MVEVAAARSRSAEVQLAFRHLDCVVRSRHNQPSVAVQLILEGRLAESALGQLRFSVLMPLAWP
jgi:hypothetical protein